MIPEAKQPAVTRALNAALGVNEFEEIHLMSGGLSPSLVFRIVVRGKPYLLRIIQRPEGFSDLALEFACMKTAAEAGIAPRVWYAHAEDRVLITDFVEARPFPTDMALQIAPVLRTLHALPHFQKPRMGSYLDTMNGFVQRLQAVPLPKSESDELFRRYAELLRVYPHNDAELVASHNDLKPQNIRYDGERIWLVDWEAVFLNDPYVDLAVVANFFVEDEVQEESYLSACFGEPAGAYRRARFFLMRQMVSMFYAAFLIPLAARSGLAIAADLTVPNYREFHRRLIADEGEALIATAAGQLQYARVHLNEALRNMRTPRFAEAVAQVGALHASPQPPTGG